MTRGGAKIFLATAVLATIAVPLEFGGAPIAFGQGSAAGAPQHPTPSTVGPPLASTARFEVASIKHINPGPDMILKVTNLPTDGRFYATGVTAKNLITIAYRVNLSWIVGGPSWISFDRFDVQAKGDRSLDEQLKQLSQDQAGLIKSQMLQQLLADRFKLSVHHETRDQPVYELIVAKNGPKVEPAKDDASTPSADDPAAGGPGGKPRMKMGSEGGEQYMQFQEGTMAYLAAVLESSVGRNVVDKTGLGGEIQLPSALDIGYGWSRRRCGGRREQILCARSGPPWSRRALPIHRPSGTAWLETATGEGAGRCSGH